MNLNSTNHKIQQIRNDLLMILVVCCRRKQIDAVFLNLKEELPKFNDSKMITYKKEFISKVRPIAVIKLFAEMYEGLIDTKPDI